MQSANIRQIKAALVDQAFTSRARVSCAIGAVVAVRRRRGQLLALTAACQKLELNSWSIYLAEKSEIILVEPVV